METPQARKDNAMKILDIFSQDATTFLSQAAAAQGLDLTVVNLYVGGCSLETHWKNYETAAQVYDYQLNGSSIGRAASINETLAEGGWDIIVTQQVSQDSGWPDTYEPFLTLLTDVFKQSAPNARLCLHETWAYENTSTHWGFMRYHRDRMEMHARVSAAYRQKAKEHALKLMPCGEVIQALREKDEFNADKGGHSLSRDGFHMSLSYGRYALALTWLKTLFDLPVSQNRFVPVSAEETDDRLLEMIRNYFA